MKEELKVLEENNASIVVDAVLSNRISVQCAWIFLRKFYIAHLVARSFTEKPGIDNSETLLPDVKHCTLRILFALSDHLNFNVTHLNMKTAFLNGYLKEDIYSSPKCICRWCEM